MLVNVLANRRDPERRIVFAKVMSKRHGYISIPSYFDNNFPMPELGELEVMISNVAFPRDKDGYFDYTAVPKHMFLRTITGVELVEHEGFECSGSMCQTLAFATLHGKRKMISPGRMMQYLPVADNVNARFYNREPYPLVPGKAYIEYNPEKGSWRVAGVPSFEELNI